MPDKRQHRGAHPQDHQLFSPETLPALREAVADLSWMLGRGYADRSSLKLVGDRYALEERQRLAVLRSACSDEARARRHTHEIAESEVRGQPVLLDGYNILTTVEAALAGGVILRGRDGCLRDLASMHGTFRRVEETLPAAELIGHALEDLDVLHVRWLLDSPVSNSGRLKGMLLELASAQGWRWGVGLEFNPDAVLSTAGEVVVTADSVILDRCDRWFNLADILLARRVPDAWIVEMDSH